MPGYGQFCPIAQAGEVRTERWTPLVIRELALVGSHRFNDIQRGVPLMSSSLLTKRLRQLERADLGVARQEDGGLVTRAPFLHQHVTGPTSSVCPQVSASAARIHVDVRSIAHPTSCRRPVRILSPADRPSIGLCSERTSGDALIQQSGTRIVDGSMAPNISVSRAPSRRSPLAWARPEIIAPSGVSRPEGRRAPRPGQLNTLRVGGYEYECWTYDAGEPNGGRITMPVTAGETYWIAVDSFNGQCSSLLSTPLRGGFDLHIRMAPTS